MLCDVMRILVTATIVVVLVGCERSSENKSYSIGIENKTSVDLSPAYVIAGENQTIPFSLYAGMKGASSDGLFYGTRPDTCIVVWSTKGKADERRVKADLTGIVPEDFVGAIDFIINEEFSVSVKFSDDRVKGPARGPYGRFVEDSKE